MRFEYSVCITVCVTRVNYVSQYVRQSESEKIACSVGWFHGVRQKRRRGDFKAMSRDIFIRAFMNKDRMRG